MTKICLIGDSHVGALQSGWLAMKHAFPEIELTTFGAPRTVFAGLDVLDGVLVPATEKLSAYFRHTTGGQVTIENSYDRYLVCGISWAIRFLLPSLAKFRAEDHVKSKRVPLSSDCYAHVVLGLMRNSLSMQVLTKLRQITDRPVTMIPAPMPSERIPAPIYASLCASGDAGKIAAQFNAAAALLAGECNAGFLEQPMETLSNPLQSLYLYKRGSVRTFGGNLDIEQGEDDYQHMNAAYGEIVLRAAFAARNAEVDP
ncbi:MAG TPA: hypothetical protein VGG10_04700 [Rhizomicrobium sp.]|jgi:hypothetical protein